MNFLDKETYNQIYNTVIRSLENHKVQVDSEYKAYPLYNRIWRISNYINSVDSDKFRFYGQSGDLTEYLFQTNLGPRIIGVSHPSDYGAYINFRYRTENYKVGFDLDCYKYNAEIYPKCKLNESLEWVHLAIKELEDYMQAQLNYNKSLNDWHINQVKWLEQQ